MRVKSLQIVGFKSFANKTTIHFEPGVTAIVGPNGVGKSNTVDAIRWVLGEHNPRDVRAPRLEDVIFNGTDRKAPLSMAEVSLTISNEQGLLPISFTEVTITRRVYRSGESECLINQSPCRLKDIQELFLGTGLGGGTYAIIEQGHIDMILSSKPEERRIAFEEASGVAKYLAKKQETMRRLDEVEEHLVRIADIMSEVRRQVGALERAANKARQYKSQWEQLKDDELRLAVDELRSGSARSGALEQQLHTLQAQRETLETQKQGYMTSLEQCNATVSSFQQHLQDRRTQIVECASQIQQHESQLSLKTRWIEELQQQATQLELEERTLQERISQLDEQLARARGAEAEIQTQLTAVQAQSGQGSEELVNLIAAMEQATKAINEAKAQLFEAAAEASHQRNQLAAVTSQLQGLDAQHTRLESQHVQRTTRADEGRQRLEALHQERTSLQAQSDESQRRVSTIQQALETAGARRHELTGRVHQLREQLATERARVKVLEDLWKRYDGFPETVKVLMSRSVEGLLGPLVELVQAVPGHEEMVEAALGPLAEALVVRDRQALTRCRDAMKEEQLEGCRFLVLEDCLSTPEVMEPLAIQAGVAGAVKQYIRTEPTYQPLVDWLLNDSWIVEDIQRWLHERPMPQGRLVSLRGDRWDRRSWRFNGARQGAQSRVGRRQRWEHAQASVQALEQEFSRLDAETQHAEQEWQSCLRQQEAAKDQWTQMIAQAQKFDGHVNQLAHDVRRSEEEQRGLELELQGLVGTREALRANLVTTQRAAHEAQERQQTIERALAEAQAAREDAQTRQQQLLITKAQIEATVTSLTERSEALRTRTQDVESDRAHVLQQVEAKGLQRKEAMQRAEDLTQQLQAHRAGGQQGQATRLTLEAEAKVVSASLQEAEGARDQALPQLLAVEQQLNTLAQQMQEQSQQLSERGFRRSRLIERLRELYQIDEATLEAQQQAEATPFTDEQRQALSDHVQTLRVKLDGMGPVSLGTVEEYDELRRRLEFLQTQQHDLMQARDDLKISITQINRTARTQFRDTFERIKQEFKHYYTRLFNGGEADLILMDEDDVLECGIDIVARPPGKRLQSISLLSGGERALTAIALLFALFKVRPSPFCILDEIDAPLDEANVDRFTRVLEEFLALSQFILITHNKKTITKADVLYGVTMEEAGISKILSAKLTQSASAPASTPSSVTA